MLVGTGFRMDINLQVHKIHNQKNILCISERLTYYL